MGHGQLSRNFVRLAIHVRIHQQVAYVPSNHHAEGNKNGARQGMNIGVRRAREFGDNHQQGGHDQGDHHVLRIKPFPLGDRFLPDRIQFIMLDPVMRVLGPGFSIRTGKREEVIREYKYRNEDHLRMLHGRIRLDSTIRFRRCASPSMNARRPTVASMSGNNCHLHIAITKKFLDHSNKNIVKSGGKVKQTDSRGRLCHISAFRLSGRPAFPLARVPSFPLSGRPADWRTGGAFSPSGPLGEGWLSSAVRPELGPDAGTWRPLRISPPLKRRPDSAGCNEGEP